MKYKKILVTGQSGTGKTYLSKYFNAQGINAYDADLVEGLGIYVSTIDGCKLEFDPKNFTEYPVASKFVWDLEVLNTFLKTQKSNVIIFGQSSNSFDSLHLFDQVFYLKVPWEKLLPRLVSEERDHPTGWGKRPEDQEIIKGGLGWLDQKSEELKLNIIDATQTSEKIFEEICLACHM